MISSCASVHESIETDRTNDRWTCGTGGTAVCAHCRFVRVGLPPSLLSLPHGVRSE
jgi:hypothetical protein